MTIDLHTHLIPGIDDGVRTLDEACEIAELLVEDGVQLAAVTPHVRDDYPTTGDVLDEGVVAVRKALAARGIDLRLISGAEVSLDYARSLPPDELVRLSYGRQGRYLLLEFPYAGWPVDLNFVVQRLLSLRLVPVLAHPERNAAVQRQPERLADVVRAGALVQLTASSVLGLLGRSARASARDLLSRGLAHTLASDVHDLRSREIGLSRAAASLRDELLASWLTRDVPAAVVAGAPIPPRQSQSRRSLTERLLGG